MSIRLELILGAMAQGKKLQLLHRSASFAWTDALDDAPPHRLPYIWAAYVHSGRFHVGCPLDTGIATDKGQAHALPLQTTVFTWDSNYACMAPPQVAQPPLMSLNGSNWRCGILGGWEGGTRGPGPRAKTWKNPSVVRFLAPKEPEI